MQQLIIFVSDVLVVQPGYSENCNRVVAVALDFGGRQFVVESLDLQHHQEVFATFKVTERLDLDFEFCHDAELLSALW